MKRFLIIAGTFLFVFISIFLVNSTMTESVNANQTSGFACVKSNNCYLYKYLTDDPQLSSKYFLLEKTYFVKVIESADENFYKVEYNKIVGYVKKSQIEFVEEVPELPFLENITFDIHSASNVELRTEPSTKGGIGSILISIPAGQKDLTYIGKITGEESISGLGNIWYYCSYNFEGKDICGYVYAPLTLNLTPICENSQVLSPVAIKNYVPLNSLLYLNISTRNLIIIVITLPSLYVLYLFIKPSKILKE